MNPLVRECIAAAVAVSISFTGVLLALPPVVRILFMLLIYVVVRSFIPVRRPVKLTEEQKKLKACRDAIDALRKQGENFPEGELQGDVRQLAGIFDSMLDRAVKNGKEIDLMGFLNPRLDKLTALLDKYRDVQATRDGNAAAEEALVQTETVFRKTREQFQSLLERRHEADAMDLKIDARIYEELMEFGEELDLAGGALERE